LEPWTSGRDAGYLLLARIALIGFPLTALLVRNRPAVVTYEKTAAPPGATVGSALSSAAFWILAGITILSAFSGNGLVTNLAAILIQHGIPAQSAAVALSVRGGAGIVGRSFVGLLLDRLSPRRIRTCLLLLSATGSLVLALAGSPGVALMGAALIGIGFGSEADVGPYLLARYFGRKHFSVLYGLMWTAYALGGGTGPIMVGHLFDRAGSYRLQVLVALAAMAFAAAAVSLLLKSSRGPVACDELHASAATSFKE